MPDQYGLAEAAARGSSFAKIGQRIVFENEHVRVWEINLGAGETIDFHIPTNFRICDFARRRENEIETISARRFKTEEVARLDRIHQRDARGAPAHQPL